MRSAKWAYPAVAIALIAVALLAAAVARAGVAGAPHATGYFSPIFTPDGRAVVAVRREAQAIVTGFGQEFFTAPATVRLLRDRFAVIEIGVPDGSVKVLQKFPPSPLERSRFQAYHRAIFGSAQAHLRWGDADHLDYEIAVSRPEIPASRIFIMRRMWNPRTRAYVESAPWQEAPATWGGDEPQQLHGDMEVIAVQGEEMMPCAIALLRSHDVRLLVQTGVCRHKYGTGITPALLAPLSRRATIEHDQLVKTTHADLVVRNRAAGRSELQAILEANRQMERLGLYPRRPDLVAEPADCAAASPVFTISDMEFTVGLFPDIEAAIASPGTEVDKWSGDYFIHRDYTTSRQINEYVNAGHSMFFVRARGKCWRLTIHRY